MKRIAAVLISAGVMLGIVATPAMATGNDNSWHLKVDICHNGTVVPVSVNATDDAQDTGHGLLTLDDSWGLHHRNVDFVSFVAHSEGNGHSTDSVLRVYWKKGNQTDVEYESESGCTGPEGPQGEPGPEGPQGPKGDKGDRGRRGPRGFPGSDGLTPVAVCTGNPGGIYFVTEEPEVLPEEHFYPNAEFPCYGPAGEDGVDGVDGKDGVDGVNGTDGKDGLNGTNGVDGSAGPVGPQGLAGQVTEVTAPVTEAPVTPPVTELPRTGASWTLILAGIGILAGGLGLAFRVLGRNSV